MNDFERLDRITKEESLPAVRCLDCRKLIMGSLVSGKDDVLYGYCTSLDDVYDVKSFSACCDYEARL